MGKYLYEEYADPDYRLDYCEEAEKTTLDDFVGQTFIAINGFKKHSECIEFISKSDVFFMKHQTMCCEEVSVEDICGEKEYLLGSDIITAEIVTNENESEDGLEHQTWSFCKLSTNKGSVTLSWYGESNAGFYRETPLIYKLIKQ